jgi:HrpA-like RNA helicase
MSKITHIISILFYKKFKFILIDEAHDRSLDVDLILFLMKKLINRNLTKNPPFLILMSATLNVDQYSKYFNTKTIFEVNGQSKPIEVIYPSLDISNIYTYTCDILKKIQEENKEKINEPKDVIIFMPNVSYIKQMIKSLHKLNLELKTKLLPLSITSLDINQGSEDYNRLVGSIEHVKIEYEGKEDVPNRRVIVSTNVAETGLTIESLKYCIDTALMFTSEFNPKYGYNILTVKPVTSSMSLQRKGRVGRKHPGIFYPLFTQDTFDYMTVDNTPNVLIEDITSHLLSILNTDTLESVNGLLTPPTNDSLNYALEKLFVLGAIDNNHQVTESGKIMNIFRKISIEMRRSLLVAIALKAPLQELIILACLSMYKTSDIFSSTDRNAKPINITSLYNEIYDYDQVYNIPSYNAFKSKITIGCEFIELILIYQTFIFKCNEYQTNIKLLQEWCVANSLSYYTLMNVAETIDEINWTFVNHININPFIRHGGYETLYDLLKTTNDSSESIFIDEIILIKNVIYQGFKMNILEYDYDSECYKDNQNNEIIVSSKLVNNLSFQQSGAKLIQSKPRFIMYKDIILKKDMSNVFKYEASTISVLDGFVDIDLQFISS